MEIGKPCVSLLYPGTIKREVCKDMYYSIQTLSFYVENIQLIAYIRIAYNLLLILHQLHNYMTISIQNPKQLLEQEMVNMTH